MNILIEVFLTSYIILLMFSFVIITIGLENIKNSILSDGIKIKHILMIFIVPSVILAIFANILAYILEKICDKSFWNITIFKIKK